MAAGGVDIGSLLAGLGAGGVGGAPGGDMMGGMGINAIESLRGNRLALRGVGLTKTELKILGVKMAGE